MQHFGGQLELYQEFWDACLTQFPNDVLEADTACELADSPSLHRLVHSLKTVFGMLGHVDLAAQAASIEASIDAGEFEAARLKWPQLRDRIQDLATGG
jgi:HPt (histidine-containing phosphotransfer) domain-containing protein